MCADVGFAVSVILSFWDWGGRCVSKGFGDAVGEDEQREAR